MKIKNTKNKNYRLASLGMLVAITAIASVAIFVGSTNASFDELAVVPEATTDVIPQRKDPAIRQRSGHSEYLRGLTRKAKSDGFGKGDVMLLAPQAGPGRAVAARRLMAATAVKGNAFGRRLNPVGLKEAKPDRRHATFTGPNSYLKVSDDGSNIVFRGNIDDQVEIRRAGKRMIEQDELEKLGREYIRGALRDLVRVGNEETVTFLGVRYLREGSYNDKGEGGEDVIANIAIFGREIRGVPVIGSGSKVAVWFANDREPVGFDIDWPVYNVTRSKQEVLSRGKLSERINATTVPINGNAKSEVGRYECGYVDLGSSKRATQLQSGCSIHYAGRNDDGTMWARVEYVPAAEKVFADPKWPLSRLIAGGRTINTASPEFAQYVRTRVPAKDDTSPEK